MDFSFRKLLFGAPLRSEHAAHARLPIVLALPIFASDALSSVAYASEAILHQFEAMQVRPDRWGSVLWISIAIVVLILMVVFSYRRVINAYSEGGGSYMVAKENLGLLAGLVAASALLVDYVLTVAVSIADCVAQSFSAISTFGASPETLLPYKSLIAVLLILLITFLNLRGVRESGAVFAGPSYGFIVVIFTMLAVGFAKSFGHEPPIHAGQAEATGKDLDWLILVRGFASGCAALTGIEAVSNGVTAFRKPEARNAALTLGILGALLAVMFTGISYLAVRFGAAPGSETIVSQIARNAFGTDMPGGIMYYAVQVFTALILFLAANTAFSGFPRLSSILAEDSFLPRQLATIGDRLAYNNGIILLGITAIGFVIVFRGEAHALLPLYTIGVFVAFTTAQFGMVRRSWRSAHRPWGDLLINGVGGVVTFVVLIVVSVSKFVVTEPILFKTRWFNVYEGAWMAMVMMAINVFIFRAIARHYRRHDSRMASIPPEASHPFRHTVIVLVPSRIHRGVVKALNYARSISADAVAVHIALDPGKLDRLREAWLEHGGDTTLIVLESPYRSLVGPLLRYLDEAELVHDDDLITVVLPEFVPERWWHSFLHNSSGWLLRLRLFFRKEVVIVSVRHWLDDEQEPRAIEAAGG